MKAFSKLFKKYRLKAEFDTFAEFGNALSQKGYFYEDSIFSHWQKGSRIPSSRQLILAILEIFKEKGAITTFEEANEFLQSTGEGYLTKEEAKRIPFDSASHIPFQVPSQIDNFIGREDVINKVIKQIAIGAILLIHGPAGVGKSALAIRLGYLLRSTFPDGVLWYRLDTSDVMDILLSIAYAYGKDISHMQDKEIRASYVRSLLAQKKALLIFDNAEIKNDIGLLLPNSKNCSIIITSRHNTLSILSQYKDVFLESFAMDETLQLFKTILGEKYVIKNKSQILELADAVGHLPLALHIFAKELKKESLTVSELLEEIRQDAITLQELSYGDKNLYLAINLSFELLDYKERKLFLSLGVFDGKDFSIDSVAFVNEVSETETKRLLERLKTVSLIEESVKDRYRIHPMIRRFLRKKLDNPALFLKTAKYYEQFLAKFDKTILKSYPNIKQESDNVLYIFKKCYELRYWDEVIVLWNPLEKLLDATNQLSKMRYVYQIVKTEKTGINVYQKIVIASLCCLLIYWIVLYSSGLKTDFLNYFFGFIWGLVPLIGGIIGFFIATSWGFFKSSIGKAVFFLSFGLFSWGIGSSIWAYYNIFFNNPIPYPSIADFGYMPSYLYWTMGMIYLPHALGGRLRSGKWYSALLIILVPFSVLVLSYFLVVFVTRNTEVFAHPTSLLKFIFDIAYPAGDVIILTTALVVGTSFKFFGGKYKIAMYTLIFGFCFQYVADFSFSYTTTMGTFYNGGIGDIFFVIGLSLLTFGVLGFYFKPEKKS